MLVMALCASGRDQRTRIFLEIYSISGLDSGDACEPISHSDGSPIRGGSWRIMSPRQPEWHKGA